jgi:hypothetical protein
MEHRKPSTLCYENSTLRKRSGVDKALPSLPSADSDSDLTVVPLTPDLRRSLGIDSKSAGNATTTNFSRKNIFNQRAALFSLPSIQMSARSNIYLPRWLESSRHDQTSLKGAQELRNALPPTFLDASARYTRKWPKPRPLKEIEEILEDGGRGLGLEKVEVWTKYKWVLMFSVLMAFCYGSASLIIAIMTWFRGKHKHHIALPNPDNNTITSMEKCRCYVRGRLRHPRSRHLCRISNDLHFVSGIDWDPS